MGIFSFFIRDNDDDEEEEELLGEEEEVELDDADRNKQELAPTGKLFEGMKLDVTTKEGEFLFSGRVSKLFKNEMSLNRLPGALSFKVVPLNTDLRLNGFDKQMIPISLSATVVESSRVILTVKNMKIESHEETRDNFRLPYSAPISIYRYDDEQLTRPENCTLVNISIGGCCIQSDYVHVEDEVIRIHIKLEDYSPLDFVGQVVRCSNQDRGKFTYGILFAQLSDMESMSLSKMLYNLQTGNRNTHTRSNVGHW